jgi:hypothetical protein
MAPEHPVDGAVVDRPSVRAVPIEERNPDVAARVDGERPPLQG